MRSKKFYKKLEEITELSKNRNDILAIAFDFMQVIYLPKIPVQDIFYMRQLGLNTFCIHNLANNKATLYQYHEGIAKKSPDEVCSFLKDFIDNFTDSVKELYVFSDGCSGHDRLYVPSEICGLITEIASRFTLKNLRTENILNFSSWWPELFKKTCISNETLCRAVPKEQKVSFHTSPYMMFTYSNEHPGAVKTCPFIDNNVVEQTFVLAKDRYSTNIPGPAPKYNGKIPIPSEKMEDIKKTISYIPHEYLDFYNDITTWPTEERRSRLDQEESVGDE
ncbi:pre-mRNA-processing factor 17 [Homalodisca vitripennis]|nr:pre-mRNA-processing factor 17 [Homalodisca vitripennis]